MNTYLNCHVCHSQITRDRILDRKAYCACGSVLNLGDRDNDDSSLGTSIRLILVALFLLGTFLHAVNWDQYFFTVIPLKVKELGGFATHQELIELSRICEARQKLNCQIQALDAAFRVDSTKIEVLPKLGELLARAGLSTKAVETLKTYRRAGGKDPLARFEYAKLLVQIGHSKDARQEFNSLLHHRGHKLHVPVARAYVGFLLTQNDYVTARQIIETYRRTGREMAYFLDKELKYIDQKSVRRQTAAQLKQ